MKKLALLSALWVFVVAVPAQTTAVYLLSDGANLTKYSDLEALRVEVVTRGSAGELCSLSAFRLNIAVVDGLPVTAVTPLSITSTGADVVEPIASASDCDDACKAIRAAMPDPPGRPADVGEACDCFGILNVPPRRVRGDQL